MRRTSKTGIVLCSAVSWCLVAANPGVTQDSVFRMVQPPRSVLDRAWSHIEDQVGVDYARANYEFLGAAAEFTDVLPGEPASEPSSYSLTFRYRPLVQLGVDDDNSRVFLWIFTDETRSPVGCVARLEGSRNVVEPRVSSAEALRIARLADIEGLDIGTAKPHFSVPIGEECGGPWVWRMETRVVGATGSCRALVAAIVDSSTGVLTVEHPGALCVD